MNCLTEFNVESAIKTWREDGYEDGRIDGIAEGKTAGKQEKAVEAAEKLLELGTMSVEQIAYVTSLPLEEVQKLAEELAAVKA